MSSTSNSVEHKSKFEDSNSVTEFVSLCEPKFCTSIRGVLTDATNDIKELARTMSNISRQQTNKTKGSEDLIRYLSHMSQVPGVEPYNNEIEDTLNPDSDNFNAKYWVKNLRKLHDSDPNVLQTIVFGNCL